MLSSIGIRRAPFFLFALLSAGVLVGCGDDGDASPGAESPSGEAGAGGSAGGQAGGGLAGVGGSAGGGSAGGGSAGGGGVGAAGSGATVSLDVSFGNEGVVEFKALTEGDPLTSIDFGPDGALYAFHSSSSSFIARLSGDGKLDEGFGQGGLFGFPDSEFGPLALRVLPDGKFLLGGYYVFDLDAGKLGPGLARLNPDGSPDSTFGTNGVVGVDTGSEGRTWDFALQGGRILAVGSGTRAKPSAFDSLALRLGADGKLDTTFHAPDGYHLYTTPPSAEHPPVTEEDLRAILPQPDGSFYACGNAFNGAGDPDRPDFDILLVRYTPEGRLDPAFGQGGAVHLDRQVSRNGYRASDNFCEALAQTPDGKIVVLGITENLVDPICSVVVARFLPDGAPDTTFGEGGSLDFAPSPWTRARAFVTLPDGGLVISGLTFDDGDDFGKAALFRLGPDGTPDASFGPGGVFSTGIDVDRLTHVVLGRQPDGKLVLGTTRTLPEFGRRSTLVRFNAL